MIKSFIVISFEVLMTFILNLPRFKVFVLLKIAFLRFCGAEVAWSTILYPNVWISPPRGLKIGSRVNLSKGVLINSKGGVSIGADTQIGYNSMIFSANHTIPMGRQPVSISGDTIGEVIIEKNVWIGGGCIILPNVKIGEGAIIAAGSVVTKSVAEYEIHGGVPAQYIKSRLHESKIRKNEK
jgi:acetyltransferase-like isoleucine patch superfamily enzyme